MQQTNKETTYLFLALAAKQNIPIAVQGQHVECAGIFLVIFFYASFAFF